MESDLPLVEWFEERRLAPSKLLPTLDTPVRAGGHASLFISPWLDRRDLGEWRGRLPFPRGYEIPCTLFSDDLAGDEARRLNDAFALIKAIHGLSPSESLSFIGQFFVAFVDSRRLKTGGGLLLNLPPSGAFDLKSEAGRERYVDEMNRPRFPLAKILKF